MDDRDGRRIPRGRRATTLNSAARARFRLERSQSGERRREAAAPGAKQRYPQPFAVRFLRIGKRPPAIIGNVVRTEPRTGRRG